MVQNIFKRVFITCLSSVSIILMGSVVLQTFTTSTASAIVTLETLNEDTTLYQPSSMTYTIYLPVVVNRGPILVSLMPDGGQNPSISADGRFVAYQSLYGQDEIFVRDLQTGQTTQVSLAYDGSSANGNSYNPSISTDGRYVAFESWATNLVNDDTNNSYDVFVRDLQVGQTTRISVASNGSQGNGDSRNPSISVDGSQIAFSSWASNLVVSDTNNTSDIFVYNQQISQTVRVSVASNGSQAKESSLHPSISANGRFIIFESLAGDLIGGSKYNTFRLFIHDQQISQTTQVFPDPISQSAISSDGNYATFVSDVSIDDNDINGIDDVFVHDFYTQQTRRVSISYNGSPVYRDSFAPSISANGRYVAFASYANNLVENDVNSQDFSDIFIRDLQTERTYLVSVTHEGGQTNAGSTSTSISADGSYIAFESVANNLISYDTNGVSDVFVYRYR